MPVKCRIKGRLFFLQKILNMNAKRITRQMYDEKELCRSA